VIHHPLLYGPRATLPLDHHHHRVAGSHENPLKLPQRVLGKAAEQRLRGPIAGQLLDGERQLADLRNFTNVRLGLTGCQILCVIELKESANLIQERRARAVAVGVLPPDIIVAPVHLRRPGRH